MNDPQDSKFIFFLLQIFNFWQCYKENFAGVPQTNSKRLAWPGVLKSRWANLIGEFCDLNMFIIVFYFM